MIVSPSPYSQPTYRFFRARADGKAGKERGGKHKMEEVRLSKLVLVLTCPTSLAKSLWGSPEPYQDRSTVSPVPELSGPSHTSAHPPLRSGSQSLVKCVAAAIAPSFVDYHVSPAHPFPQWRKGTGAPATGHNLLTQALLDTKFSCHHTLQFFALDSAPSTFIPHPV